MLAARHPGKKILVVEDDFVLGEALSLILGADGYMVALATNGQEALQRLRAPERPHLILLDLMLPGMSGWEFRQVQQEVAELANIPTVIVSAVSDIIAQAAKLGVIAYLQKPVETSDLLSTVRRCCG